MNINIADQYFLKALENYPYDFHEAIEALNYTLSYAEEHAGAHCLLGRIYMTELKCTKHAQHHFELSLMYDVTYVESYYNYPYLLISIEEYRKAQRLLYQGMQIRGINKWNILTLSGHLYECQGKWDLAKLSFQNADFYSLSHNQIEYITDSLKRVKSKGRRDKKEI